MSQPAKRWVVAEPDEELVAEVARVHGLVPAIARVVVNRGLVDQEAIGQYLLPRLDRLSDPFLLPGMELAVSRIWQAIDTQQRILVYGDYDVDGVTSTTLLIALLDGLGNRPTAFIPHRIDDGYGLSVETVEAVHAASQPDLIITVDCGTGSVDAVERARELGIDVIVTDHHETSSAVAQALAVVNPKCGDDAALQTLAGVGVAFKLSHALLKQGRNEGRAVAESFDLRSLLYLVAMGTVADMVPLVGENRILATAGIRALNREKSVGLKALCDVAGIKEAISAYHIGFLLGPRINAAGRMESPETALQLLLSDQAAEAQAIADQLDAANQERQETEKRMFDEAVAQIDATVDPAETHAIVVADTGWHAGVVGIVASRLVQKYYRPTMVIALDEHGSGKGSCRSIDAFDLVAGLGEVAGRLRKFGGHKMAAGLEIDAAEVVRFREEINAVAKKMLSVQELVPKIKIDGWLSCDEVGYPLLEGIERLRPFGLKNPTPVWGLKQVGIRDAREVGKGHLKMVLDLEGRAVDAIAFNRVPAELPDEGVIDVAFQLKMNRFRGAENLQMNVSDFRAAAAG